MDNLVVFFCQRDLETRLESQSMERDRDLQWNEHVDSSSILKRVVAGFVRVFCVQATLKLGHPP